LQRDAAHAIVERIRVRDQGQQSHDEKRRH
jgi:hypothetical protein